MISFVLKKKRVLLCCLLVAASFVWRERHFLEENPFRSERRLEKPSWVSTSREGITLVIDRSRTRVSVIRDGEGGREVHGTALGGSDAGGFYYAEYAITDGEKLYIADIEYASVGTGVVREEIVQYSLDGRFERTVFLRDYPNPAGRPLQYGNIRSLQYRGGALSFVLKNGPSLELYRFPERGEKPAASESAPDGGARLVRRTAPPPGEAAFNPRHVLYDAARDILYAMTLRAVLYAEENGNENENENGALRQLFDWSGNGKDDGIPWGIAVDSRGKLFVADLVRCSVVALPEYEEIFTSPGVAYGLHINENDVVTLTDTESVYLLTRTGEVLFSGGTFAVNGGRLLLTRFLWALAVALGSFALFAACSLTVRLISRQSLARRLFPIVALSTAVTSILIGASLFDANGRRLDEYHRLNLVQLTSALSEISSLTWGDDLESIETLGDYEGEAFARIRSILAPPCDTAGREGSYLYYMVYRYSWEDDELYGVMDYEDTLCAVYPMEKLSGSRYGEVASGGIPFFYESSSDSYGSWTYVVAPVRGSRGEIVGLLEFGYNRFADRLVNARQIRGIAFDTAALIVLFLLLFSEGMEALLPLLAPHGRFSAGVPELVRPIIFIAYFADSADAAFITPLAARLFAASGSFLPISVALGAALPLSVNLLCCLFASAVGARLVERLGARRALNGGILTESMGSFLCFWGVTESSYGLLLAGMALTGAGMGALTAACDAVILCYGEERRGRLFANFNAGILSGVVAGVSVGSYVAKFFGYSAVFAFSAAAVFLVLFFGFRSVSTEDAPIEAAPVGGATAAAEEPAPAGSFLRFWRDRDVVSFFSFSMFPFLVILYYKDYIFPLYASDLGYSEVAVGQTLLFSGAAAIWMGPPVTEYLLERLGEKYANAAANVLYIAGLLIFAAAPSFETAVFTTCVTTAAAGFGLTTQNVYFTSLESTRAYGHNRAMGAFNTADSLFQSAGPMLLGALLLLGYRWACAAVGIVGAVFLVLFLLLSRGKKTPLPPPSRAPAAGR